jgi:HSP20 family protein
MDDQIRNPQSAIRNPQFGRLMAITNPLHPLSKEVAEQLREQMRRMLVRLDEMRAMASSPSGWAPPVDVCELDDAILVRVELPGVSINNVRATMLDNVLRVEGRKDRETPTGQLPLEPEQSIRFICLERSYGNFAFSIPLKWPIDAANVSAKMTNGVLEIRLLKTQTCGREITIPITE